MSFCRFNISLSTSFEEDVKTEGEWDQLLVNATQNTVFLAEGWLKAWFETVGANQSLILAKVRSEGILVAAAAFQEDQGIVEFAGKGPSDYSNFLVSKELSPADATEVVALILNSVRRHPRRFNFFLLGRVPTDNSIIDCLSRLKDYNLHATICRPATAPSMDMIVADEKLKKKSLRRHERSLERMGQVSDVTHTHAADILPLLETFFEQHISRWQHTDSPSLFVNPANREFYRRFIRYLDGSGWLRFTLLRLDDKVIATHCGFLTGDRFTWYKPTFDIQMQKWSPGEVLIKRLIERAKEENAAEFDFTIGDEAFKYRFATKIRQVVYVHVTDSWPKAAIRRARVYLGRKWAERKANGDKK